MTIILFIFMPLGWAATRRLLGKAVALSVPAQRGNHPGGVLGRCCMWLFPIVYLLLVFAGVSGDAGHGVRIFGSEELFDLLCLPFYALPCLCIYVAVLY